MFFLQGNSLSMQPIASPNIPLSQDEFARQAGVTLTTIWRWRQRGWLKTINIAGRQYVPREEIDRFNTRAAKGEFATSVKPPKRKLATA